MSNGQVAIAGALAGYGGINYDLLAAAMLRQGVVGGGTVLQGEKKSVTVESDIASAVRRGETAVVSGESRTEVGVAVDRGREGAKSVASEDSFGVIPQSDDVTSEAGSSALSVESSSSVSGGVPGEVSEVVRETVKFGGIVDAYGDGGRPGGTPVLGFCALTSRRHQTKLLADCVSKLMGVKIPKGAMIELGVCTYTAGTMPDIVRDGVAKLRSLAAIGDAAVTLHVTAAAYAKGLDVRSAQSIRSAKTSNSNMCEIMKKTGMYEFVTYAPGVDPFTSTTSATAFEAIVGVLVMYRTFEDVKVFLGKVGMA